ncbi:hypothetical protein GGR56DRAFT_662312 [Xylariaceae sp. FL0804]|nr:hypothetical protein GGR56DRAFT_662312 [Xylariaceae sp. FL0804]
MDTATMSRAPMSRAQQVQHLNIVFLLLAIAKVPFKSPRDQDWARYSCTFNQRLPVVPALVVLPRHADQVCTAVAYAAQHSLKVQARSGGHSYASHSNGGSDGAMVIDLRHFQSVELDTKSGIAKVGGGIRLGNLALALYRLGKRALAHGTCPGVGIGGQFTHGGYGFSSRCWGLAMDQIVGLDVVMADGKLVHANAKQNTAATPQAMRGAGDSFGIVVEFHLQTHPPEKVVSWKLDIPGATRSVARAVDSFLNLQDLVNDASAPVDRRLGFGVSLGPATWAAGGTWFGSHDEFHAALAPRLRSDVPAAGCDAVLTSHEVDWVTSLKLLAEGAALEMAMGKDITEGEEEDEKEEANADA